MGRQFPKLPWGSETYSVTALRDWECLYRGEQKRLKKRKEPLSPALHEGRILHDVAARYVQTCCQQGVETDLSAIGPIVHEVFFDPNADEPHSLPVEQVVETERVARQWAERTIIDYAHTAHVEEIWAPQVTALRPAPYFYAVCDHVLIDGDQATIRDLKSDRAVRSQSEVEGDLQLWSYCWAVAQQYPHVRHFRVELDFIRHGVVRVAEWGPEIVERAERVIVESIERIRGYQKRKQFPAIAGDGCKYCGFRAECPLLQNLADPGVIVDQSDAMRSASTLHALDALRDSLRSKLRDWTAEQGPVAVGGTAYGHWLQHGQTVDDVRAFAAALGDSAWDALRVDGRKLKSLLRNPAFEGALLDLVVDTSRTEFSGRKHVDEDAEPNGQTLLGEEVSA